MILLENEWYIYIGYAINDDVVVTGSVAGADAIIGVVSETGVVNTEGREGVKMVVAGTNGEWVLFIIWNVFEDLIFFVPFVDRVMFGDEFVYVLVAVLGGTSC